MNQKYKGREEFLERIKKPECPSISVLSEELSIPKATLYAWIYTEKKKSLPGMKKRQSNLTPVKKFSLLSQSDGLKGKSLQEFCSLHGVGLDELQSWRDLALSAIDHTQSGSVISKHEFDSQIAKRDKEITRKNAALAETAALLVLQKKISDIFAEEE
jgi:transposase